MAYTITQIEELSGISAHTLRYYDKCGFFPSLSRDNRGRRIYSDEDFAQLELVHALRKSGLSIEGIKYYVTLSKQSGTDEERAGILKEQVQRMNLLIDEQQKCKNRLEEEFRGLNT